MYMYMYITIIIIIIIIIILIIINNIIILLIIIIIIIIVRQAARPPGRVGQPDWPGSLRSKPLFSSRWDSGHTKPSIFNNLPPLYAPSFTGVTLPLHDKH